MRKEYFRELSPPILWQLASNVKKSIYGNGHANNGLAEWEYIPEGWAYTQAHPEIKGWDVENILDIYKQKWPTFAAMAQGTTPLGVAHESNLVSNEDIGHQNTILAFGYALALAARHTNKVSFLDWGGGIGHYYLLAQSLLPHVEIDYHCKDVPVLADYGAQLFPQEHFYADDSCLERTYDFVLSSGSLHFSEGWEDLLGGLARATAGHMLVTRLPMVLDADLYLFADLAPIYTELGEQSVLIVGHRYADDLRYLEKYGIYNVGILIFRNDPHGKNCLSWWRARCLEWCYDKLEDGKYTDQKYLDNWPTRFPGVVVLQHPGAGLAPWNVSNFTVCTENGHVRVNEVPLIFYHFHGLKTLNLNLADPFLSKFNGTLTKDLLQGVYAPYLRALAAEKKFLSHQFPLKSRSTRNRSHRSLARIANSNDALILLAGPIVTNIQLGPYLRPLLSLRRYLIDAILTGNIFRKKRPSKKISS